MRLPTPLLTVTGPSNSEPRSGGFQKGINAPIGGATHSVPACSQPRIGSDEAAVALHVDDGAAENSVLHTLFPLIVLLWLACFAIVLTAAVWFQVIAE